MKHAVLTLIMVVAACVSGVCGEPADSAAIRSFEALERRAAQGDENARFRVARTLETGFGNVVKRDSLRARRLLEQGVANGYAPRRTISASSSSTSSSPTAPSTSLWRPPTKAT